MAARHMVGMAVLPIRCHDNPGPEPADFQGDGVDLFLARVEPPVREPQVGAHGQAKNP
ncbi:hypothetical protein D3C81_2097300 [compost metagenome]